MWYSDWGWGSALVMSVAMLAFWALLAWLMIGVLRGRGAEDERAQDPEQILQERFARGEIDEHEFLQRLETLRSGRQRDTIGVK